MKPKAPRTLLARMVALAGAGALLLTGGTAFAQARGNWTATVTTAANGAHTLGNPKADVKLTEFVSYTCSHCATFEKESNAPLRLAYVMPGKVSVTVHHLIRDPIDLTAAMLTNCGNPAGFFKRHHAFLYNQDKWLSKIGGITEGQKQRWSNGPVPDRLKAVARDFGFYEMMSPLGLGASQVSACLSDKAMLDRIVAQTREASEMGVNATPSFAINGEVQDGTHTWQAVDAALKSRF